MVCVCHCGLATLGFADTFLVAPTRYRAFLRVPDPDAPFRSLFDADGFIHAEADKHVRKYKVPFCEQVSQPPTYTCCAMLRGGRPADCDQGWWKRCRHRSSGFWTCERPSLSATLHWPSSTRVSRLTWMAPLQKLEVRGRIVWSEVAVLTPSSCPCASRQLRRCCCVTWRSLDARLPSHVSVGSKSRARPGEL